MADPASRAPWGWRSLTPAVLVAAVAVGYIGVDVAGSLEEPLVELAPPLAHAGVVVLQAAALLVRHRLPGAVFAVVVALDLVILGTTGGDLGIGALGVVFASFALARSRGLRPALLPLTLGATATVVVGSVAMLTAPVPALLVFVAAVSRVALLYALPAAAADYLAGRERLTLALRDRAALMERERQERADREVRAERAALARELHDIAGHHLSGIIVSAQAASALTGSDPSRARALLQHVQDDARTALADLRRTVGLLRSDDESGGGAPPPTPSLDRLSDLVTDARGRGQQVMFTVTGEPRGIGPLAETAAYRMVQESLSNTARHAPGAASAVDLDYGPDAVRITVRNEPPTRPTLEQPRATRPGRTSFGLAGMAERAALIGGVLETAPTPDGGWRNALTIPTTTRETPE